MSYLLTVLDNGLTVIAKPMDHMESVSIGIWIRAGGRYENISNNGISHLLEHLLFKGTTTRDMKTIKEAIEGRGGSFNGFTAEEFTCYLVKVLGKDMELAVDILTDMVFRPRLAAEEIVKEKDVIVEEINMYKDLPSHYVHEILAEMMWPNQPLGMPLAGTEESVRAINRDMIVSYRDLCYNPKNIILVGVGRMQAEEFTALAKKYCSGERSAAAVQFAKVKLPQDAARCVLHTKNTEQTHVALGVHALDRFHPDKHVLSLANVILGANMSSRLFHIVRDEMALCYEISSSIRRYHDTGAFVVSAGVDHKKLPKAVEVMLREIGRLKSEPVSGEELGRAKEYYKGQLLFAMEDTMSQMLWLGEKVTSGEDDCSVQAILKKIDMVGGDDIMRVSRDIFRTGNINLAVIGPSKDEKTLQGLLRFE